MARATIGQLPGELVRDPSLMRKGIPGFVLENLAGQLGVQGVSPGLEFQAGGDIFRVVPGSEGGSALGLQRAGTARGEFNERLRGEEEAFLGRFRTQFPTILSGLEEQLQLQPLREEAFGLTQQLRGLPQSLEQEARGADISQRQLDRMIAARASELRPQQQQAVSQAQFAEQEFGRRAQQALVPFETELGLLKDRLAREATGYREDAESRLNILLERMRQEGALARQEMQEATRLAELEQQKEQYQNTVDTVNLGDRVALVDPFGNEVGSLPIGLSPTREATGGGLDTLQQWEFF